ncbi:MAG: amidohydrolase family protein [Lachnospiraceae bacterium]|nr:amidohydrolase family protein [Lachnospiraceae bacterium]
MIIDSHMHLIDTGCFDKPTYDALGQSIPADTDIDQLVSWMRAAGIGNCVCMGQDMQRIWHSEFGEIAVERAYEKYPEFFIPFCSVEPIDSAGRFCQKNYDYVERKITECGYKGILFTPPYGQFHSNDRAMYPFYELANAKGAVVQYHHSAAGGPTVLAHTKFAKMENLNDVTFDFPNMKIVVEHIGYPFSEYLFTMMVNDENLWTDLAMLYKRPFWMTWNMVLAKELGVLDRVMFASDFVAANNDLFHANPAQDLLEWIDLIRHGMNKICENAGWPVFSEKEIEGILHDNAARLYGL